MRKRITLLIAGLMLALSMSFGGVAFAGKGGEPRTGSCGVGKAEAHEHQANPTEPGASEERLEPLGTCGTDVQP
jgi:hypothetical protein